MKHLYMIGGPMGVGKTAVCQTLKRKLDRSVFLDGDWCWDMHPFVVTEETKAMATDNMIHLLTSFIRCSEIEHILFCWVMHEQAIIDDLLSRLPLEGCAVHPISLICAEDTLRLRLQKDVDSGLRSPDVIKRSLERLPMYSILNTRRIDTTHMTIEEAAKAILHN